MTRGHQPRQTASSPKTPPPHGPQGAKGNGTALGRDAILAAEDSQLIPVPIPEWGGTVYVRTMTAADRDRLEAETTQLQLANKPTNGRARIAVICCCDADGAQLFTDRDVDALAAKASKPMERIAEAAAKLNYIRFRDIEDMEKN